MNRVRQFFQPPVLLDENRARRANLLSFLINLHFFVAIGVAILLATAVREGAIFPLSALATCIPALATRILLRNDKISLAAGIFIGFIAMTMPVVAYVGNSSVGSVSVTAFQFLTIIMAGLLLGGRGTLGFLLFTCGVDGLMLYAEAHQWYQVNVTHNLVEIWMLQVITFVAAGALLWFANRLIQNSFGRARRENVERRSAEEKVKQLNLELEQKLAEHKQLISELEAKNIELERFVYTVSHDLKSPLVTINGFLGYLEKDARTGNMERMQTDLERITNATDKMQRLLGELLELSRIGRMMNPPQDVPFNEIVKEAMALVRGQMEARGVEVRVAPDLPHIYGDRARLVEVIQNLLDNAVKFMGDQSHPQIDIGTRGVDEEGNPILYVQDNGIGIAPPYHEKVFGLFNKLDPHTDGTGVGLALVRRIIEVHGGRIWIESKGDGHGTTFCFIIVAKPK